AMKLTGGLSKKIGLPDYGSLGATCGLEFELPEPGDHADPGAVERRALAAFDACARVVEGELRRRRPRPGPPPGGLVEGGSPGGGADRPDESVCRRRRPATPSQLQALRSACDRRRVDAVGLVRGRFGVAGPEALTVAEASHLIAGLRGSADAGEPSQDPQA
ncbi:hypothetical protein, partial [Paludisphaera soli]|uniref:hypothetical protein n=1 Tax=Paludisphaera soli TaxID=2712865 RepID=UPI0013EC07C4